MSITSSSPALMLIEQHKCCASLTTQEASEAFEAMLVNLGHTLRLAEVIARKSTSRTSRVDAGTVAYLTALLSADVERAMDHLKPLAPSPARLTIVA